MGNVDAGKSTLLGVLTHGELDNGRGFARQKLFRHKHEMESGRTSSVGNDILGFDSCGNVVNKPDHGHLDWIKICEDAAKVFSNGYCMSINNWVCLPLVLFSVSLLSLKMITFIISIFVNIINTCSVKWILSVYFLLN